MTEIRGPAATEPWLAPALPARDFSRQLGDEVPWRPLRQFWRAGDPERGFQPGWARLFWAPDALFYEIAFVGSHQHNRALALNERTWELGDVGEIFVAADGAPHYVELHITPENHRLQLLFPHGAIDEVRAGRAELSAFMVSRLDWVETSTSSQSDGLTLRARLPASILGVGSTLDPDRPLRTAVCRYDYGLAPSEPILSSTAPLLAPSFHRLAEWNPVRLTRANSVAS